MALSGKEDAKKRRLYSLLLWVILVLGNVTVHWEYLLLLEFVNTKNFSKAWITPVISALVSLRQSSNLRPFWAP